MISVSLTVRNQDLKSYFKVFKTLFSLIDSNICFLSLYPYEYLNIFCFTTGHLNKYKGRKLLYINYNILKFTILLKAKYNASKKVKTINIIPILHVNVYQLSS